jgi:hypothetical protein
LVRPEATGALADNKRLDILWISTRVFVTLHKFEDGGKRFVEHLYTVQVSVNKATLNLQAYRLSTVEGSGQEELEPTPALPLLFFAHLLALHLVQSIRITVSASPPVDAILTLVPSTAQRIAKPITIVLVNATADLLPGITSSALPKNEMMFCKNFSAQFISKVLIRWLTSEATANHSRPTPLLESLSIVADGSAPLSSKMIDGIVRNPKTSHLTVESTDWID